MRIEIAGIGLIGKERLAALDRLRKEEFDVEITGIFDPYSKEIQALSEEYGVNVTGSFEKMIEAKPDWIFIATPHDTAVELTKKSLENNINVLIEKPLGRNLKEAKEIYEMSRSKDDVWVGFNYRFFDGVNALLKDTLAGKFGKLISINFVLGHGSSPNIKDGWKLDPEKAGGGCLIDPGIHFIDLARIFTKGNLDIINGMLWNGFWKTGIEEECHLFLNGEGCIINMQISIVKWRSTFRIEVNGEEGYGIVDGRNRSYGKQTYITGKRWGWQNAKSQKDSELLICDSDGEDVFYKETRALLFPDNNDIIKPCNLIEGLKNMELLEKSYMRSKYVTK
ncbi:MAG: Gfo/Idh/MocA family oxidoreductase [Ignavibacteria bacterium]